MGNSPYDRESLVKNKMILSKENATQYTWGNQCFGWRLVDTESLSIIQELMPPHTTEKLHYHNRAQQFFRILEGEATFVIEGKIIIVESGNGIHISPKTKHLIRNDNDTDLEFLLISEPSSRGDRIEEPSIE